MDEEIKIQLPEGCTKVDVKVENGVAILKPSQEGSYKPEDGDFVYVEGLVFISREGSLNEYYALASVKNDYVYINSKCGYNENLYAARPATLKETAYLIEVLRKNGKRWNEEKKLVEPLPRWRAKKGEYFYYVHHSHGVAEMIEKEKDMNDQLYRQGNYFRSFEAAHKCWEKIKEILKNSKEDVV